MTERRYRAAIIGGGRMGGLLEDEQPPNTFRKPHGHFAAYSAVEETEVVAVAGRRPGRLKLFTERFGMTNTYLDYREMIEKERPEIVSVTTQSRYRAEAILFAVEHGVRGIYAEKGPVRLPGRGGCHRRGLPLEGRGLQLRGRAPLPRRVRAPAPGHRGRRHRHAAVRLHLLVHRSHEAPLPLLRHRGHAPRGPGAGLGRGPARGAGGSPRPRRFPHGPPPRGTR